MIGNFELSAIVALESDLCVHKGFLLPQDSCDGRSIHLGRELPMALRTAVGNKDWTLSWECDKVAYGRRGRDVTSIPSLGGAC